MSATVTGIVLVVTATSVGSILVIGPAAADHHTYDEAPDMDEKANFTVAFPYPTDHYPGDQNEGNGSIEYWAAGEDALTELGAENGFWLRTIVLEADWIDYSACTTENIGAFGLDRGNNNTGTRSDESLLEHRKDDNFRSDGLDIYFYGWDDFAGDPPYMASQDAIVAYQGKAEGPCLTLTSEPGWYQVQGFLNGTVADEDCTEEGNPDCQPETTEWMGIRSKSNYIYVCECDSEPEAREALGPPPSEKTPPDSGDEATPTSTGPGTIDDDPTPTPTSTDPQSLDAGTPTPTKIPSSAAGAQTRTDTPTATDTDESSGGGATGDSGGDDAGGSADTGNDTPTVGGAPGFTPVVAIVALLGAALLALRRR